jgi:hydrogenase 3 maturation protease
VIVGIGNTLKGDDAAGLLVCEQLQKAKVSAHIIDAGTVPENYIQSIIKKAPQNLLLIDAIDFGNEAGTIGVFKAEQLSSLVISTHTLSPRIFIDMIRQSIELNVYCVGIQPAQTQLGRSVSEQVDHAIQKLCRILTQIFPPVV